MANCKIVCLLLRKLGAALSTNGKFGSERCNQSRDVDPGQTDRESRKRFCMLVDLLGKVIPYLTMSRDHNACQNYRQNLRQPAGAQRHEVDKIFADRVSSSCRYVEAPALYGYSMPIDS